MYLLSQGKEFLHLIPKGWMKRYNRLNFWQKARLSKLLSEGGGSFNIILKKSKIDISKNN